MFVCIYVYVYTYIIIHGHFTYYSSVYHTAFNFQLLYFSQLFSALYVSNWIIVFLLVWFGLIFQCEYIGHNDVILWPKYHSAHRTLTRVINERFETLNEAIRMNALETIPCYAQTKYQTHHVSNFQHKYMRACACAFDEAWWERDNTSEWEKTNDK